MTLTKLKAKHPKGQSMCSCGLRPGLAIGYGDMLFGFDEFGLLLEVGVA